MNSRRETVTQWLLCLFAHPLPWVALVALIVWVWPKAPQYPIECDPKQEVCVWVEYLEYYENVPSPKDRLVAVGAVFVDGRLSHSKNGLNRPWWVEDYTEEARFRTPASIVALAGCPDGYNDGEEALEIIHEIQTVADRSKVEMAGRA